ncbi:hypothetical protein OOK44_38120 [Streptomyces cellulosae]|uniref:hypothetical protein n=1 Tax=Streptomyces cellulosae TaxID=1968 RepID=UPI00225BF7A3|nr:hypothetical protein [Streptomyces cellulosae]MCX4482194.1 hypothetical protein [Streptomyces cellulosae]
MDLFDEAVATLEGYRRKATADELDELTALAGRDDAPVLLYLAWQLGKADKAALTPHVGPSWSAAEYPDQMLTHTQWRALFRLVGFTVDGVPAPRPEQPLTLWRGSVPGRRADWSWTTDRAVAEGYARGTAARRPATGRLYRLEAPPAALLCANTERDEAEYVVDTRRLTIREEAATLTASSAPTT